MHRASLFAHKPDIVWLCRQDAENYGRAWSVAAEGQHVPARRFVLGPRCLYIFLPCVHSSMYYFIAADIWNTALKRLIESFSVHAPGVAIVPHTHITPATLHHTATSPHLPPPVLPCSVLSCAQLILCRNLRPSFKQFPPRFANVRVSVFVCSFPVYFCRRPPLGPRRTPQPSNAWPPARIALRSSAASFLTLTRNRSHFIAVFFPLACLLFVTGRADSVGGLARAR